MVLARLEDRSLGGLRWRQRGSVIFWADIVGQARLLELLEVRLATAVKVPLRLLLATDNLALSRFGAVALADALRFDNALTVFDFTVATLVLETAVCHVVVIAVARRTGGGYCLYGIE